jgi:hypothetical protein
MITPEHIQQLLHQKPFKPFTVCLSDGENYQVEQSERVKVINEILIVEFPGRTPSKNPKFKFPEGWIDELSRGREVQIALSHITHLIIPESKEPKN